MKETSTKVYFHGLNGLRFIAATAVIVEHVEYHKTNAGFESFNIEPLSVIGTIAVLFFFVLSGFLITYLLFKEKEVTGAISAKNFYIRRILRIWPLYYIIFILGFFILPFIPFMSAGRLTVDMMKHYTPHFLLNFFMLPNISRALLPVIPYNGQAWSIGVEEQFYLIWPLLIKYSRNYLRTVLSVVFIYVFLLALVLPAANKFLPEGAMHNFIHGFTRVVRQTPIVCMGIGATGAYLLYFEKKKFLDFIFSRVFQYFLYAITFLMLASVIKYTLWLQMFISVLFTCIIVNIAANPASIFRLNNRGMNYLGKISYGMYMYHSIVIIAVINLTRMYFDHLSFAIGLGLHLVIIGATIGVSAISYRYLEEPFLRLKLKFTKVRSGDEISEREVSTMPATSE